MIRLFTIPLVVLCTCLSSCNSNQKDKVVTHYPDGHIKAEVEINNDSVADGVLKVYYPSGTLKEVSIMKNGHYNGESISYYESGKLKSKYIFDNNVQQGQFFTFYKNGNVQYSGTQLDGFPIGKHFEYYENDSGILKYESYYIRVEDDYEVAKQIEYDLTGEIIQTSSYVKAYGFRDTLTYGDTTHLKLNLENKKGDFIHFFIGDFSVPTDTLKAHNGSVNLKLIHNNRGLNFLKGFVLDEKVVKKEGDQIFTEGYRRYFEFSYYIQ